MNAVRDSPLYSSCQEAEPTPSSSSRSLILFISRTTLRQMDEDGQCPALSNKRTYFMIVCLEPTRIHTPQATCNLSQLFSPRLSWLHSRYLQFKIIPMVAGDHRPPTYQRHSSLRTFHMHLIPSQTNSVGLQTGMTSLEITGKRHRVLL